MCYSSGDFVYCNIIDKILSIRSWHLSDNMLIKCNYQPHHIINHTLMFDVSTAGDIEDLI